MTVAKVIPILVFILLSLFALDVDVFVDNVSGGDGLGCLFDQVRGTMLATVFVFLGVEGASVYSRYAQKREDVGRATVARLRQRAERLRQRHDRLVRHPAPGRDRRAPPAVDGRRDGGGGGRAGAPCS